MSDKTTTPEMLAEGFRNLRKTVEEREAARKREVSRVIQEGGLRGAAPYTLERVQDSTFLLAFTKLNPEEAIELLRCRAGQMRAKMGTVELEPNNR